MIEIGYIYNHNDVKCKENIITDNETFKDIKYYKITLKKRYRHNNTSDRWSTIFSDQFNSQILYEFLNSTDDCNFFSKYGFLFIMSPIMTETRSESYDDILTVEVSKINKIKRRLFLTNKLVKYIFDTTLNNVNYLDMINSLLELISSKNYVSVIARSLKYISKIYLPINLNEILMDENEISIYNMLNNNNLLKEFMANSFYSHDKAETDITKAYSNFLYDLYNTHLDELGPKEKTLFEVLYTACFKIKEIEENPLTGKRLNNVKENDLISIYDIDDEFIFKLRNAIKHIVLEEIDYNLYASITPNFIYSIGSINRFEPTFIHRTLLVALYHTILIDGKNNKFTRICQHCGKVFTVDNINSKRLYCPNNDKCKNNANKQTQRKRQREKK